jgi:hypothetical protein
MDANNFLQFWNLTIGGEMQLRGYELADAKNRNSNRSFGHEHFVKMHGNLSPPESSGALNTPLHTTSLRKSNKASVETYEQ